MAGAASRRPDAAPTSEVTPASNAAPAPAGRPTLRQLQIFVHAYRLGSLTQAARAVHVTQSAASVALQHLEESLGILLFDRDGRALSPTPQAREVFEMAQRVLHGMDHLVHSARGLAARHQGTLRFAVTAAIAATIAPMVLKRFRDLYPGIRPIMYDVGPDQLVAPVLERQVEFSIGTPDAGTAAVRLTPLLRDRLAVICPADNPLAARERLTWRDLDGVPIITVRPANGIRSVVDKAMAQAGLTLEPSWEVSYLSTALALTARGLGVSVLPRYLITAAPYPELRTRVLHEPEVRRTLYLISSTEHSLSPAAQALVDMFTETLHSAAAS